MVCGLLDINAFKASQCLLGYWQFKSKTGKVRKYERLAVDNYLVDVVAIDDKPLADAYKHCCCFTELCGKGFFPSHQGSYL